jgi:A-macroglobulin TED domain/Alpha-2-macroglobulin family/MG2 domain/Alpha-2-macroglobulin bait region domain/A-macroglobulin receptor binding domain
MRTWILFASSLLIVVGPGCGSDDEAIKEVLEGYGAKLSESDISATMAGKDLTVKMVLQRSGTANANTALSGKLSISLMQLGESKVQSAGSTSFQLDAGKKTLSVPLQAPSITSAGELGGYTLHYTVELPDGALHGRRSLYMAVERSGIVVIGNNRFAVGEKGVLRVISLAPGGKRLAGTPVKVRFTADSSSSSRTVIQGKTNAVGELQVSFTPTAAEQGGGSIAVTAGMHSSTHSVLVEPHRSQILLTTDKPLYQPGQTVHIRALAMKQPAVVPLTGEKLLLELEDPAGNKLHKQETKTDGHGIASLRFDLARLVNLGTYTVRIIMGTTTRTKTFEVKRYTLPKFKVTLGTNATYYKPGATVTGWVQADYFFSKHVQQGAVKLTITAPPAKKPLQEIVGKTDSKGRFDFSLKAPAGAAMILEAQVTDASGAVARGGTSLTLTDSDRLLQVIPERRRYYVGQKNRFFVLLSDPAGAPLSGSVSLSADGASAAVQVPKSGLAELTLPATSSCPQVVLAQDGALGVKVNVTCATAGALRLETDKALYGPGDTAKVTVRGPAKVASAQLEVLRNNATVQTATVKLVKGVGSLNLTLSGTLKRTLTLKAHAIDSDAAIMDRKLIHVASADQLTVTVSSDKTSYRPAETAKLKLKITDASGKPAPGALGVQVVDEALYALTEVKPGIERSTFYLEQEMIEASKGLKLVGPQVLLTSKPTADDQLKARILFAAAGDETTYPINYRSLDKEMPQAISASRAGISALTADLQQAIDAWFDAEDPPGQSAVEAWFNRWLKGRIDDFGQPYKVSVQVSNSSYDSYVSITLRSAGMDELWKTQDDLSASASASGYHGGGWGYYDAGMAMADSSAAADMYTSADAGAPPPGSDGGSGSSAPKLRQYFPETLYVDPALITDSAGEASIDLALADSITSWRLTSIAHTQKGQLGSSVAGITVFQEFFVDTLLPTHLLQNDEVEIPVAIYNYLGSAQTVTVKLKGESWFDLLDADTKQVVVPAKSVSAATFKLRVKQVGTFSFTATGTSSSESDAVKRSIRVLPDGERKEIVRSGALTPGTTTETISIPAAAIDGASELFVKVYPGLLAEVVEGFESILKKPYGCFEQTSSATYPNVMVMQYLKSSGKSTPKLEAKAISYINEGYQKLVAYEVSGGGFSLWGKPPANIVLTAFGLMEFSDMAKVRFVDKALIQRTQNWLVGKQSSGGAFVPPSSYGYYEIPGNAAKGSLRTTAYVAWALSHSGYKGAALTSALSYVKQNAAKSTDIYTMALCANALLSASSSDPNGLALLTKLKAAATPAGAESVKWESKGCSLTYGYGDSMAVETTALVVGALLLAKDSSNSTQKGLRYLSEAKGSYGGYGTTQATVLALRALILSLQNQGGDKANGTLQVLHNAVSQGSATVTPQTSDVTRLFDLKQVLVEGSNKVVVVFNGKGELAYQVVAVYYLPHSVSAGKGPLTFSVTYDKTTIKLGDKIKVTAKVGNTGSGDIPTVMMRLGLPPGFSVELASLTALPGINAAELDGPYVVLYLGNLKQGAPQEVIFEMTSTLVSKGKAPASIAYPYYTPEFVQIAQTPVVVVSP